MTTQPSSGVLLREVTIFVSSPGDVQTERERLDGVVEELNRGLARSNGLVFRTLRWERDAVPAAGDAQQQINRQLGRYDIFVGLMWKRFGTPTRTAGSGTEEELRLALDRWEKLGAPRIMFYFCERPFFPSGAELEELARVREFRNYVEGRTLSATYLDVDDFADKLRSHLTTLVLETLDPQPADTRGRGGDAPAPAGTATAAAAGRPPPRPRPHLVSSRPQDQIACDLLADSLVRLSGVEAEYGITRAEARRVVRFLDSHRFNVDTSWMGRRRLVHGLRRMAPRHRVEVRPFLLSDSPVTNRLFGFFVENTGYLTTAEAEEAAATWRSFLGPDRDQHPVRAVSFLDAEEFCRWSGYRLPTTDEWERAVRGTDGRFLPWGNEWRLGVCNDVFWVEDRETSDVRRFHDGISSDGIYDLCGNVYEWVVAPETTQPGVQMLAGGGFKVSGMLRGNAALRIRAPVLAHADDAGFRIARDL